MLGEARDSLAGQSRYCTEFVDLGAELGVIDRWLEWLRDSAPPGAVVLPCGDDGLDLLASHSDELREWGLRPAPTAGEASRAMLDKEETAAIAAAAGVPAPATWTVANLEQLEAIAGDLEYPCALKPLHSHLFARHFDFKVFVAEGYAQLRDALAQTSEHGLEMQVTEIIPGGDDRYWSSMMFIDEGGEPAFLATKRKLRSHPIHFGVGTYHLTEWDPEVAEMSVRFVRGAGLRGLASVEFKRDARDGSLKLIECNHRFIGPTEMFVRAGLNVPLIAYKLTLGERPEVGSCRDGVRLWMPARDLRAARDMRAEGDLTWPRWLTSLLRYPTYLSVLSLGDLKPSLVNTARRFRNRWLLSFGGAAG